MTDKLWKLTTNWDCFSGGGKQKETPMGYTVTKS